MSESRENQTWKTLGVNGKSLLLRSECSESPLAPLKNLSFHSDVCWVTLLFTQSYYHILGFSLSFGRKRTK